MKNNNQINVPQAREAMDKFKMQAASEEMYLLHLNVPHYARIQHSNTSYSGVSSRMLT